MIGNPYLDFSIEPFSATLRRFDLVSSSAPPGFNYGVFNNGMTDLASAGFDPTLNTPDGYYPLYNVTARAIPITVNINAKETSFSSGTYREKYEVVKVNNTQHYADITVQCDSDSYIVNFGWWRDTNAADTPYRYFFKTMPDITGLTRMVQMLNGMPGHESLGQVSSCSPLIASGTSKSVCSPCGLYNPPDGQTYTALAYWRMRYSYDSGATYSTGIYNYSYQPFNFTMDWIITE